MTCGIYKIQNKINGHIYIGQSINIERRFQGHKKNSSQVIDQAIKKYGIDNFSFEIIEECLPSQLDEREKYWINYYNSYNEGYNCTLGGQSCSIPQKLSFDQVNEIKKLLISTKKTNKEIAEIFNVSENIISGINTGYYWHLEKEDYPIRKIVKEEKQKISRYPAPEILKQILIENNGNFTKVGKIFGVNDNSIRKVCKKYNLPYHSKDYQQPKQIIPPKNSNIPIRVAQCEKESGKIIRIFESIKDAEKITKIQHIYAASDPNNLSRQTAGGYIWKRL